LVTASQFRPTSQTDTHVHSKYDRREPNMSITYYPQINGIITQRPYLTEAAFLNLTNDLDCGVRYSYSTRLDPLSKFTVNHVAITDAEINTLEAFFGSMGGRYQSFAFLNPTGNLVTSSESFAGGVADPFGGTAAGFTSGVSSTVLPSDANGIILCTSIWVKPSSPNQSFTIGHSGSFGTVLVPSTNWTRINHSGAVVGSGAVTASVSGGFNLMFGFQCSATLGPNAYSKTPGSGKAYFPNCRFDTDVFTVNYVGPNQNSLSLPIVEVGF